VARDRGDALTARAIFARVLQAHPQFTPAIFALEGMACVECMGGRFERAARLFGAADGYRAALSNSAWEKDRRDQARYINLARARLSEATYDIEFAAGCAMMLEQAIELALDFDTPDLQEARALLAKI